MMLRHCSAFKLAPPTSAPSTSGCCNKEYKLSGKRFHRPGLLAKVVKNDKLGIIISHRHRAPRETTKLPPNACSARGSRTSAIGKPEK
jgi:hypothetical protein